MKKKILFFGTAIFLGILVYISFPRWSSHFDIKKKILESERRRVAWMVLEGEIKKESEKFPGEIGILIKDLKTTKQIVVHPDKIFPAASLVKIPIMAACCYAENEGRISLKEILRLSGSNKYSGSGKLKYTAVGTALTIDKLMELMISESDNTATNMLIERLGFDYLNACFKRMGLKDSNICRRMMDFNSRREGKENFTTASDLAFILEEIYKNRLINKRYSQLCLGFLKKQKIKDRIPSKLPKETEVAHKTGLERGVCHDAGIIFTPKGDFLICVLAKHQNKTAGLAKRFIAQIAFQVYSNAQSF